MDLKYEQKHWQSCHNNIENWHKDVILTVDEWLKKKSQQVGEFSCKNKPIILKNIREQVSVGLEGHNLPVSHSTRWILMYLTFLWVTIFTLFIWFQGAHQSFCML